MAYMPVSSKLTFLVGFLVTYPVVMNSILYFVQFLYMYDEMPWICTQDGILENQNTKV